jgi:hypothetical protein
MDEQTPASIAQWVLWVTPVILSAVGASWYFFTKIWFPNQQELQRKRHEENQKQRDHERAVAELTAKQQVESKKDQQDHIQKSQGDALEAVLGVNTKLIEHLIEQGNGRSTEMVRQLAIMANTLIKMEGMMQVANRDWSRIDEIVADIDTELNTLKEMVRSVLVKHGIKLPEDEVK